MHPHTATSEEPDPTPALPDADLWTAARNGDLEARHALVTRHLGLVYFAAHQWARGLADDQMVAELVSAGAIGLLHAVAHFDPTRGRAFSTFALPRIRGAMADDRRRADPLPRTVRQRLRDLRDARHRAEQRLGRTPSPWELATALDIPVDVLWSWEAEIAAAEPLALPDETDPLRGAVVATTETATADEVLTREQEMHALRGALGRLKEKERLVLVLYYYEELKMHEIAATLGVTEGRVSQLRTAALAKLRATLAPLRDAVA